MKNKTIAIVILILASVSLVAQTKQSPNIEKRHQKDLLNEFYVAYGIGSLFYFVSQGGSYNNISPGSFIGGYTRSLNKVIVVGFQIAYTPVTTNYSDNGSSPSTRIKTINNYLQALARVSFRYLNQPAFSMYSGIALGVTMDYYTNTTRSGSSTNYQKLLPAGQLTLLGFRFGRGIAFCGEFGIGTLSILNFGVSFKFGE